MRAIPHVEGMAKSIFPLLSSGYEPEISFFKYTYSRLYKEHPIIQSQVVIFIKRTFRAEKSQSQGKSQSKT